MVERSLQRDTSTSDVEGCPGATITAVDVGSLIYEIPDYVDRA